MAKENYAFFIAQVVSNPVLCKGNVTMYTYKVKTIRRNNKLDINTVRAIAPEAVEEAAKIKIGDMVMIRGFIATPSSTVYYKCPECGSELRKSSNPTQIFAISNVIFTNDRPLEDFIEMSNTVKLIGVVSKQPGCKEINNGLKISHYQIAINRRIRVEGQERTSDYPFVTSYGEQAEQDYERLTVGSQVYIDGGLQTRELVKTLKCDCCGKSFQATMEVSEIVPYSVEYLNNCKFTNEEEKEEIIN